ncbi:hypothetical protein [Clostridium sp. Cult2]|uniref:hypothetical protein n=1 Tax=Clostridium sp. Cult2 TaxID=2079003 RepID=UPI001F2ED91D|nr:hypothetical protein [Clostridium sp. Cult2]MCF6466369.1 hypothetical protein [Clostridium sp. Cult2]
MEIDKYYKKTKKSSLKNEIERYIDEIVDTAEKMNSLDYFNIEISNHEGKLNVEYKLKNRKKVY